MIKLQSLRKVFKSDLLTQPFVALDDVSFDVPEGSMVGFLGANGAGKTTSLKIIMDFIRQLLVQLFFHLNLDLQNSKFLKILVFSLNGLISTQH